MSSDRSDGSDGDGPAETVRRVTGTGVAIRGNEIDTDQIIPARFLKVVTFDGLGQFAFFDQRFTADDDPKDHPMNEDRFRNANVMVVNKNFGCGSSREHAPQALKRWGIDALVGESFAEIFAGNCVALGIPTVTADAETVETLQNWIDEHPDGEIAVDVAAETVTYGDDAMEDDGDDALGDDGDDALGDDGDDALGDDGDDTKGVDGDATAGGRRTVDVSVADAQRTALVDGVWDTTALMASNADAVADTAASLPYIEGDGS